MNSLKLRNYLVWRISVAIAIVFSFQFGLFKKASEPKESIVSSKDLNQSIQKWQFVSGSITDGKSLKVARGKEEYSLKLCGIDSPTPTQPLGIEARDYLKSLVDKGDGTVFVTPIEEDKLGNVVAEVFVLIGDRKAMLLNSQMIASGYASRIKASNCPNQKGLIIAEKAASKIK